MDKFFYLLTLHFFHFVSFMHFCNFFHALKENKGNLEVFLGSWWCFHQSCWLRVRLRWPWNFWICPWKCLENTLNFQLKKSYAPWVWLPGSSKYPNYPIAKYSHSIVDQFWFATSSISTEPVQVTVCWRVMVLIRFGNWHPWLFGISQHISQMTCVCFNDNLAPNYMSGSIRGYPIFISTSRLGQGIDKSWIRFSPSPHKSAPPPPPPPARSFCG